MSTTTVMSVTAAISAVIRDLPSIGKADKSPEGYQYRGIEAITRHLQPLLAAHGVVIVPTAHVESVTPSPAMKDGWQDVRLAVEWTIYGPDGSSIMARTVGIGRDRSDKGANKAQTQAYKYLLLHLLGVADRADDSDGQTYEHDRVERVERPSFSVESLRLYERAKAAPDHVKTELRALADAKARKLTVAAFDDDEQWRAVVAGVLDAAVVVS